MIENIQIYIENVHIRYEDDRAVGQPIFSCGITLQKAVACSTDEQFADVALELQKKEKSVFKVCWARHHFNALIYGSSWSL